MKYNIKNKRELPVKCKIYLLNALTYSEKAKDIYVDKYKDFFYTDNNSEVNFVSQLRLNQCLAIAKENIFNMYNYCNIRNYRKVLVNRLKDLNNDFDLLIGAVEDFKIVKEKDNELLKYFEDNIDNIKMGIEDIVYNRI